MRMIAFLGVFLISGISGAPMATGEQPPSIDPPSVMLEEPAEDEQGTNESAHEDEVLRLLEARTNWRFHSSVDPITDANNSSIILHASSHPGRAALAIRCLDGNAYELFVGANDYIGREPAMVTYRLDSETPVTERWPISTSGTAVFYPLPRNIRNILDSLAEHERLVVRITTWRGETITITFDLTGADQAISLLDCNAQ